MFTATPSVQRPLRYAAALATLAFVSGCAYMPFWGDDQDHSSNASTEQDKRASTLTDAQTQARGGRDRAHASSQVSLGFGDSKGATTATPASSSVAELSQTQTFLGTIACAPTATNCAPVRLVITMHPDGMWRLRAHDAIAKGNPTVAQGCWHQIGSVPNRILLQTENDTILTDLTFSNPNQVRVNVFNYVSPKLETHLSRQPDIDLIPELENQTGPTCRS